MSLRAPPRSELVIMLFQLLDTAGPSRVPHEIIRAAAVRSPSPPWTQREAGLPGPSRRSLAGTPSRLYDTHCDSHITIRSHCRPGSADIAKREPA